MLRVGPRVLPRVAFQQSRGHRYRLRFSKLGRASFISHLDTMRLLQRMLRRAGVEMIYSQGFHPKPELSFGPALALGVASLGEVCDLRVESREGLPIPADELQRRLQAAAPEGIVIDDLVALGDSDPLVTRLIAFSDLAIGVPVSGDLVTDLSQVATFAERPLLVQRRRKNETATIDVGRYLVSAQVAPAADAARLRAQLLWPETLAVLLARVRIQGDGGAKPLEVAEALLCQAAPVGTRYARVALSAEGGLDLCDLPLLRAMRAAQTAQAAPAIEAPAPPTEPTV